MASRKKSEKLGVGRQLLQNAGHALRGAVTELPWDIMHAITSVLRYAVATAVAVTVLRWMGVLAQGGNELSSVILR